MEDEPVRLWIDVSRLTDEELHALDSQAETGAHLGLDRIGVASIFSMVQGAALAEMYARPEGAPGGVMPGQWASEARPDPSAPLSHQATDLGYAMALIMPLVEDAASSDAVRAVWNDVLHALGAELRRRGPPA